MSAAGRASSSRRGVGATDLTRAGEVRAGRAAGVKIHAARADVHRMAWWAWLTCGWAVLAVIVAVPLGLSIRLADRRAAEPPAPAPASAAVPPVLPPQETRRRRIPLPPLAVVLGGTGLALEVIGFAVRVTGADRRGTAQLLSMDAPMSLPRLFVSALFAVAALVAFAAAARGTTRRRGWWSAVGLVSAIIAEVKAGGTLHTRALTALGLDDHPVTALVGSAAVVAVVLVGLWVLSRHDRRDRRRVLSALALYGLAAGGLSSVSAIVATHTGASVWTALATFTEEGTELVGAVAVLTAVLIGVAPRTVLPADWALRRAADATTLDAPGQLPGWAPETVRRGG